MLSDAFGKSPEVRIIDHFLLHEDFEYTKTEIAKYAKVARASVYAKLSQLLRSGILVESKKIGRISLYKLNLNSPAVKRLRALNFQMAKAIADAEEIKPTKEKAAVTHRAAPA